MSGDNRARSACAPKAPNAMPRNPAMAAPIYKSRSKRLERPAVEVLDGDLVEIEAVDAADVDGRDLVALGVHALAEHLDAAGLAELVLDDVLVEGVGAHGIRRGFDLHRLARLEHEQRPAALAD